MRSKSSEFAFLGPVGGKVSQVIGPVIDIRYKGRAIPEIYTAIEIMDSSSSKLAKYVQVVADFAETNYTHDHYNHAAPIHSAMRYHQNLPAGKWSLLHSPHK